MRVFDLSTLPPADVGRLSGGPLMITPVVHPSHQEKVLDYWVRSLGLPSVEVDWRGGLLPASRSLLERYLVHFGNGGALVIVRVDEPDLNLERLLASPTLAAFEQAALVTTQNGHGVRLRRLSTLTGVISEHLRSQYMELCDLLPLRQTAWDALESALASIIDPGEWVEAANALVEVQLEGLREDQWISAVRRRLLVRHVHALPPREFVSLLAVATGKASSADPASLAELAERDLVQEASLVGWARWLGEPDLVRGMFASAGSALRPEPALEKWIEPVKAAARGMEDREPTPHWASAELEVAAGLVRAGELDRARGALALLSMELEHPATSDAWRSDYWFVVGLLRSAEGRHEEAHAAFRSSVEFARSPCVPGHYLIAAETELARCLRLGGRWPEAESAFREALRLLGENGAPTARVATLHELATGLRDVGRWAEAEAAFRESLRLGQDAGIPPEYRKVTLHELGTGLRDNGRWPEAETALRESLRIGEEVRSTPGAREATLHALGRGLRDHGRWPEAEAAFRESLRIAEEEGATPSSRAVTLHELAVGLRNNGHWAEAEAAFREALRSGEEGGETDGSRAVTLEELALLLRIRHRFAEAKRATREAERLRSSG